MSGLVDPVGRALVTLRIRANRDAPHLEIQAWIDTAFNGELVIPKQLVEAAQLQQSAGIEARLADGNVVLLESFTCLLDWFGTDRTVEVVASEGAFPLLGIGLLIGHRLLIDYRQMTLAID